MVRDYVLKAAKLLLLIGVAAGVAGQVELLKPGIFFLSGTSFLNLLIVHAWATAISLVVICFCTLPLLRNKTTRAQWAIWLGFGALPLLYGGLLNVVLANLPPEAYLADTFYVTAKRHAYGTAGLLVALGGLSALQRVKFKALQLKISFVFAFLITASGLALSVLQAQVGLQGMPRRYVDYPEEFTPLQLWSGNAALTCLFLSGVYVILLWRHSNKKPGIAEAVF